MRTPEPATNRRPTRAVAIVNPATGHTPLSTIVGALLREAARHGVELAIEQTTHAGHAVDLARAASGHADLLIAVGGDGTISDIVTGALGADVTVAIVPVGSTNVIARELGIPRRVERAAAVALGSDEAVTIDVARMETTTFMHMAGAGFDAAIMRDTSSSWKRRLGWLAYIPPAIRNLTAPRFTARLTIDGHRIEKSARLVLCAVGGAIVLPRFQVAAGIDRSDGILDVLVYNPPGPITALTCVGWLGIGRPDRSRWLTRYRGKHVHLDADQPVPFEVDGDYAGLLPTEMAIIERAVSVRVPSDLTPR